MGGDLPDYTRTITVLLEAEILSQVRQLPWWVRYNPSRVVFLDDFEGVLKWSQVSGTVAKESSIRVFEASNCLSFLTAAAAGSDSQALFALGAMPRSKIGVQLRWNVQTEEVEQDSFKLFEVQLIYGDAVALDTILLRYLYYDGATAEKKWQYYDEDGNFTDIPDADEDMELDVLKHHSLYFTFDLRSPYKFGRLVTSQLDLDISDLSYNHSAGSVTPYFEIRPRVEANTDIAVKMVIDAVLISDEEP